MWGGENGRNFKRRAVRAILPLAMLSANGGLPQSILSDFSPRVGAVSAEELQKPEEQADYLQELVLAVAKIIEKHDLLALFPIIAPSTNDSLYWKVYREPKKDRSTNTAGIHLGFQFSYRKSGKLPECVGYVSGWENRPTDTVIIFKNLHYLRDNTSGYSAVLLMDVPSAVPIYQIRTRRIYGVEEIEQKDLEEILSKTTPCKTGNIPKPVQSVEQPEPVQPVDAKKTEIKVELPAEIANGRIAFISRFNNQGSVELQLVEASDFKPRSITSIEQSASLGIEWPKWTKGGAILFEDSYEIYSVDVATGKITKVVERTFDLKKNPGGYLVECPSIDSKSGNIYISLLFGTSEHSIFLLDSEGNLKQITKNNHISMVETCGLASPDGKRIAFQRHIDGMHDPKVHGLVISNLDTIPKDVTNDKVIIQGSSTPLEWSQDGRYLLAMTGDRRAKDINQYSGLILLDTKTGEQKKITDKTTGGTFSPDGNYVFFALNNPSSPEAELYLFSVKDGGLRKVGVVPYYVSTPVWEKKYDIPKPQFLPRKIVQVYPGLGSSVHNGQMDGNLIDNLVDRLVGERGFSPTDIWPTSLVGWSITENGFYMPKDQACEDTLRASETNGEYVVQTLLDTQKQNPEAEINLVTHSLGSIRVLAGLHKLIEKYPDFDFTKLTVIVTDGPNYGVDKPTLGHLFAWLSQSQNLPKDCNLNLTLFDLPHPYEANYPAIVELKDWWEKYDARSIYLAGLVRRLTDRGVKIFALGSLDDCVMDSITCNEGNLMEDRIRLSRNDPRMLTSLTQILPKPAITIMRHMGNSVFDPLGHSRYLTSNAGLNITTAIIGDQYPSPSKPVA